MKNDISKEYDERLAKLKKELKFKTPLQTFEEIYGIKDFFRDKGFVPDNLTKWILGRIRDFHSDWYGFLHGLLIPIPNSIASISQSKMFNDEEKEEIEKLLTQTSLFLSRYPLNLLEKNKISDGKYIDDSIEFWKMIRQKLIEINKKICIGWKERATQVKKRVPERSIT